MAKKLSLFIEDNNLWVLLCNNERVVKWANLPLEAGIIANGVVTDEEKLAALIRQQLKFLKVGQKWAIIGLTGLNSLYRIVTLPQIPDNLLSEAIRHEAERVMPIVINDVYLSYQVIPGGNPGEERIFLAAFPKAGADSMLRTIWRAGLKPYMLDLAPLALSRTISQVRAIAVNSRGSNLDIVVISDKIPQVLRSIPLPSEAESLTEKLAAIAEEVERTIAFYNQSQPEKPLDEKVPVLVTGDLAQMKENWDLLATRLGHPVLPIPSPMQEPAGFDAGQFMVNIGLILKESPREKGPQASLLVNFNALPEAYHRRQISPLNIILPVVAVVVLAGVIVMVYITLGLQSQVGVLEAEAASTQSRITTTQKDITTLRTQIKVLQDPVKPLEDKIATLNAKLATLKTSRTNKDEYTRKMVDLIPLDVTLSSLTYVEDIALTGSASSRAILLNNDYARAIRGTNLFDVLVTSITATSSTDPNITDLYTYSFTVKIR